MCYGGIDFVNLFPWNLHRSRLFSLAIISAVFSKEAIREKIICQRAYEFFQIESIFAGPYFGAFCSLRVKWKPKKSKGWCELQPQPTICFCSFVCKYFYQFNHIVWLKKANQTPNGCRWIKIGDKKRFLPARFYIYYYYYYIKANV